jgi:hypothetical protein
MEKEYSFIMKFNLSLFILCVMLFQTSAQAETLSLSEIWRKVQENSPAQEGAQLKTQSVEAGRSRAENHWLPKVYLNAQMYRTNDPSNSFFGLLEQRKVQSQDFSPDSINNPDSQTFTRGALGVDLALYEGGMKQAQVEMYHHLMAAEKLQSSQIQIDQYTQTCLSYGSIAVLQKQQAKLEDLNSELTKLIKSYRLGQKSNPVGYSALLGMKSLANRVADLIEQFNAEKNAAYSALHEMGVKSENWSPKSFDTRAFTDQYLTSIKLNEFAESYKTQAAKESAQASTHASRMEKARYLPRIGAFAESYVFTGSRDTANGYTGGLYLQWNLFDPADYGKYNEAKLAALANEKFSQATVQQENAERDGLQEAEKAIRANLVHLEDSDSLLSEQARVSSTLFRNGSINALQFVEILNRRTDLISQQSEAEINLLKTAADRAKKSQFEIPDIAMTGGQK